MRQPEHVLLHQPTRPDRVAVEQVHLPVMQQEIPQVQVLVAEPRLTQIVYKGTHLLRQPKPVRHRLAAKVEVVQVQIELYRGLERFQDHRVPQALSNAKAGEVGYGARRRDRSLLQPLEALELPERRAAAEEPPPSRAREESRRPRVELEVVRPPIMLEAPDLPISSVLDQRRDPRHVAQGIFEFERRSGHGRVFICARGKDVLAYGGDATSAAVSRPVATSSGIIPLRA